MSNNIIKYICLALLLAACQEDEALLPDLQEPSDKFEVTIPLGIAPETGWNYETEYVPMQTRSEKSNLAWVEKQFAGLVMKEIDGSWYVDTLQYGNLDAVKEVPYRRYLLTGKDNIGKIDLILSPGNYKILVITADKHTVTWNPDLKRGYPIKKANDYNGIIPYACTYWLTTIGSVDYSTLYKEIFAGIRDFTVSKTGDLHSSPQNGNNTLTLTRRVSKYRIALEGMENPPEEQVNLFPDTEHFIKLKLRTEYPHAFCQGIDCFGKAYYDDPEKTNQEINIIISATRFRYSTEYPNESYQVVTPYNSTHSSQYLFIDPELEKGIPYQISTMTVDGQSNGPIYIFKDKFFEQTLYPNSITGITLQAERTDYDEYTMSLKPKRDPATMFSPTLEIDYGPNE